MNWRPGERRDHLAPDVLAEFRAGLITGRRARAVGTHLTGCAGCAAQDQRLAQVSALLAAAPLPPVPETLARRLDSALAAEVISAERQSVHSPSPRRSPSWAGLLRIRVLATATAAAAALGGVGYALSTAGQHSALSGASAAAGSGSAAARPNANPVSSTFNGSRHETAGNNSAGGSTGGDAGPLIVVSSGVNYLPATLRTQLRAELSASGSTPGAPSGSPSGAPASAAITACVRGLTAGDTVRLVQRARFAGAPAYVIVASGSTGEQAWITGLGCSPAHSDVLDHVVLSSGISAP